MQIHSGYKTITPIQLANALWALDQGQIDHRALRVYLACFALVAVREAAQRYRRKRRERPKECHHYRLCELERLTGLAPATVRRALRQLERAGLVRFTEGEVTLRRETLPGSEKLQEALSCRRSPKRPIPVPRCILRFLARTGSETLLKTIVAYLVRGLTIARNTGEICGRGTVKASWIAETLGLSQRAVKYAQAELRAMGWISKDTGSRQRKLNRDGAYFSIHLDWRFRQEQSPCARAETGDRPPTPLVNPDKEVQEFAPLPSENTTVFAPPYKDRKTSIESKNQKAQQTEPVRSGDCLKSVGDATKGILPAATLTNLRIEDFHQFSRLETLYFQTIERGWIKPTEASALDFIAAAVRAREVGRDVARVFFAIVRRGLWHHITQAQEDRARIALVRFRADDPARFRTSGGTVSQRAA